MSKPELTPSLRAPSPVRIEVHLARLDLHAGPQASSRLLRRLLADRMGLPESALRIGRGPEGKPRVEGGGPEFSLSHRGRWCAVALSDNIPVGVDLEPIRPFPGMAEVAAQFFPPMAQEQLRWADPEHRAAVFFRWWTRLEAAVKATGRGLDHGPEALRRVTFQSVAGWPGLALAVAARTSRPLHLEVWALPFAGKDGASPRGAEGTFLRDASSGPDDPPA